MKVPMKNNKPLFRLKVLFALLVSFSTGQAPLFAAEGNAVGDANKSKVVTAETKIDKQPDVIYVPTPQEVVDKMLELAEVKKGDVVYDLGCGDGRIMVTAAKKYGVKAIGFDIDPERIKEAQENVRTNKVGHLVTVKRADIFTLDLREATVVTLYLLPELNVKLMPQLAKLKPGSRIVSHDFDMRGAKPVVVHNINSEGKEDDEEDFGGHTIYKWIVPWEKEGNAGK